MDYYFAFFLFLVFVLSVVTNFVLLRAYYFGLRRLSLSPLKKKLRLRKPAIGGVGITMVYLVGLAIAFYKFDLRFFSTTQFLALNISAFLAFASGSYIERNSRKNLIRLSLQIVCGALLCLGGIQMDVFDVDGLNSLLTILWVVVLMNSFTFLNSMNAITSIVTAFSLVYFMLHFAITRNIDSVAIMTFGSLWASVFAFLFFNWFPPQLRLGEAGAQFLGLILSGLSVLVCWNAAFLPVDRSAYPGWLVAFLLFLFPLANFLIVVINRLIARQPVFNKRNDDVAYHLFYLGMRKNLVAVSVSFFTMIHFTAALIVAYYIEKWTTFTCLMFVGYAIFIFLTLFLISRRNLQQSKYSYLRK